MLPGTNMGRLPRKEKCWQCDRRRSDVTLRMYNDRLCQDCDNVNRAGLECRACADKPSVSVSVSNDSRPTVTVSDGTSTANQQARWCNC